MNESMENANLDGVESGLQKKVVGGFDRNHLAGPSSMLLRAAVSGLLSLGIAACSDDDDKDEADPDQKSDSSAAEECEPMACECDDDGGDDKKGGEHEGHTTETMMGDMSCPEPDLEKLCGMDDGQDDSKTSMEDEAEPEIVEKELSTEDVQHTYAELIAMCDEREGYVEIHASCSGVNTCQGFFYGDWGEDAQLVEHTCSGVNGCAGLSCLVPATEEEREPLTGEEIMKLDDAWYAERAGDYGPRPCKTCHVPAEYNEEMQDYVYDYSKLKLPLWPDSGRDASNWLGRPAVEQEQIVAFGAQGIRPDGVRFSNMVSYAKLFSKAEIKAVVEYMRGFAAEDTIPNDIKLEPGEPAQP